MDQLRGKFVSPQTLKLEDIPCSVKEVEKTVKYISRLKGTLCFLHTSPESLKHILLNNSTYSKIINVKISQKA